MKIIINPENNRVFLEDLSGNRFFVRGFSSNQDSVEFADDLRKVLKSVKVYIQGEANKILVPEKEGLRS
jgi:hypothetical protein